MRTNQASDNFNGQASMNTYKELDSSILLPLMYKQIIQLKVKNNKADQR